MYLLFFYLNALAWLLLGLLSIGSIINGSDGLMINIVLGSLFILIGIYFYLRTKNHQKLLLLFAEKKADQYFKHFILLEKILISMSLFFIFILLSGVIHRIFGENMPVFG